MLCYLIASNESGFNVREFETKGEARKTMKAEYKDILSKMRKENLEEVKTGQERCCIYFTGKGIHGFCSWQILNGEAYTKRYVTREDWLAGVGGSDEDFVSLYYYRDKTEEEMRKILLEQIKEFREENPDAWEYGTEFTDEFEEKRGSIYGYACFCDYHADFTARRLKDAEE